MPVVARKKGLDGHYESADGSQQIKKVVNPIAPVRSDCPHSSYDCRRLSLIAPLIIPIFIHKFVALLTSTFSI